MYHNMKVTRRGLLLSAAGLGATAGILGGMPRLAFADTALERAKADGFIRVGFANEAPFGYSTPDGKLTGEAPEVAKAVLAKMGIPQVDGVLTEFGSLIPGLKAKRFDIIATSETPFAPQAGLGLVRQLLADRFNLKMRVESLTSRLEFNERRARALETSVVYRPSPQERVEAPPPREARPEEAAPHVVIDSDQAVSFSREMLDRLRTNQARGTGHDDLTH